MPGFDISDAFSAMCHEDDITHENLRTESPLNTVETARKHRYALEVLEPFRGPEDDGILLYLEKCTRPTPEFETVTIHNGQDEIYRPGKVKWNPIEFTFYEKTTGDDNDLTNQAAELIYKWWAEITAVISESRHTLPVAYYKNAELAMLDGEGRSIWTYFLYDCWIQKVTPSDLAYADSDLSNISVIMRYNKAQEQQKRT